MEEPELKLNLDYSNLKKEHHDNNQIKRTFKNKDKNEVNNNEIKMIINKNENNIFSYNYKVKLNNIILNNNNIKDRINEIELEMNKIIKTDSLNILIKNINQNLLKIKDDINNNNEIILNLLNNNNKKENNNINCNKENSVISEDKKYMNKIKSNFIIKKIFSICNEKDKLKLVKYNKNLQNKIGIKLINYKLFTGIYIEYESKEKGKEYFGYDGKLRFKGKYFNGKRNGRGKEYNNDDILIFEGEYLNGEKNGQGKEKWARKRI